jgi:hypothetical protein
MKIGNLILTLSAFLICVSGVIAQQTPCTDEDAYNKAGVWKRQGVDDLASPDVTFSKTDFPKVLARVQKAVELLKKTNPKLTGVEGRVHRSIRGHSYFPNGALPFAVEAGYKIYYCVPDVPTYPETRGKILPNSEKGVGINIFFNTLGWITNESVRKNLRAANGQGIYYLPHAVDKLNEMPVLSPIFFRKNDELLVIAPYDANLFIILSREDYLLARKREIQIEIKKLQSEADKKLKEKNESLAKLEADKIYTAQQKQQFRAIYEKGYNDYVSSAMPKAVKYFEDLDKEFDRLLQEMPPAERASPAIIASPTTVPPKGKVFVTEQEGGRKIFTVNKDFFNPNLPRDAIQLISVYLFWDDKHPVETKFVKEFKEKFDFQALRQMLGK